MITFKCKMCGGELEFHQGATVAECPFCGVRQTLPKLDDDRRANLYDRANHFRRQNEYDKAMTLYERILQEDRSDAEAYWSLVLCRYGIEYVEDPSTRKRVPTVNRVQYTSVLADEDYKSALSYADSVQQEVYRQEANTIDEIQKGILAISSKEEPFDVFICYKETDAAGRRTPDSVLANDLYHQLVNEGFKVFFSRITLEDKIGSAYEPYIFAALNSAKVMVVLGTKSEYFNAVWVKNEWSRFFALIKAGADKTLVPAYRDMDPYDLPEEFSHLQAQDMAKLGFMQDLIRGIKKITRKDAVAPAQPTVQPPQQAAAAQGGVTVESLMKRAKLFLEDADFSSAGEYLDKVLDIDPEYAPAYIGKVQVAFRLRTEKEIGKCTAQFENGGDWQKALRFASPEQAAAYRNLLDASMAAREEKRKEEAYAAANRDMQYAKTPEEFRAVKAKFIALGDFLKSAQKAAECEQNALRAQYNIAKECLNRAAQPSIYLKAAEHFDGAKGYSDAEAQAEFCRKKANELLEEAYDKAVAKLNGAKIAAEFRSAKFAFSNLEGYRDSNEKADYAKKMADKTEEQERIEKERRAKAGKRSAIIATIAVVLFAALVIVFFTTIKPAMNYKSAQKLLAEGNYDEAAIKFYSLGDYEDARAMAYNCYVEKGNVLLENGDYDGAITAYRVSGNNANDTVVKSRISNAYYLKGEALMAAGDYDGALKAFKDAGDYEDAPIRMLEVQYLKGEALLAEGNYNGAMQAFSAAGDYKDANERVKEAIYRKAEAYLAEGNYEEASRTFKSAGNYKDAAERVNDIYYRKAESYLVEGNYDGAAQAFKSAGDYSDAAERAQVIYYDTAMDFIENGEPLKALPALRMAGDYKDAPEYAAEYEAFASNCLSAGKDHTAVLKMNGNVYAKGYNFHKQCNVSGWKDIVAVSAGGDFTVGLKSDGTVMFTGGNPPSRYDVSKWTDIVAVSAGSAHIIGLKADGTVVATGDNYAGRCNVSHWKDIIAVSAGSGHSVGLKADGTVVAVGKNDDGQCNVSEWTNIVAVSAGDNHTIGLKADGTVVSVGSNRNYQCNVSGWKDIVTISAGDSYTIGLKADGTVVAKGYNFYGQCNVHAWTDIVAIDAGEKHTIGLKSDGTVVATGDNNFSQCDISGWDIA